MNESISTPSDEEKILADFVAAFEKDGLKAIDDFAARTGQIRGVKLAGGIRTSKEAVRYLVMVNEVAGAAWLHPATFRLGASSLLNDLLLQRHKLSTGAYDGPDYVSID